jgi:hypothetical protein
MTLFLAWFFALTGAAGSPQTAKLRVEAIVDKGLVGARLTNTSQAPLDLEVGYSCSGPHELTAIIDGKESSFVTDLRTCTRNVPHIQKMTAGASTVVWSEKIQLDAKPHQVRVRYHVAAGPAVHAWTGEIVSDPLDLPAK